LPRIPENILARNPHLDGYVSRIRDIYGEPEFFEDLSLDMKYLESFNIVYPVGNPVYIHAYARSFSERFYNVIEPQIDPEIISRVDAIFARMAANIDAPEDPEERSKVIADLADRIITKSKKLRFRKNRAEIPEEIYDAVRYAVLKDKVGYGLIEAFMRDPYLEDVTYPGSGCIHVYHRIFGAMVSNICFEDNDELNRFIIRISERIGKPVSRARPIVDAVLPDGSRVNIVYGEDVSLKGSNFTIRKFSKEPISVVQLIRWGTMSAEIASYLWMALREQMYVWICGETASGKTTTLNAIAAFIPPDYKIISIEDTAEVNLPHENWVRELTRDTGSPESSITMFDLLRTALRQRPNYIIVGEIRGREGNIAFQAKQTGHGVLSTFHAANIQRLVQRITGSPIEVPPSYLDNLNIAVFQSAVYDKRGRLMRRVIEVDEIMGYDDKKGSVLYIPVFTWDPNEDRHIYSGRGSSYILEHKMLLRRGLPRTQISRIYDELYLRARYLALLDRNNITSYIDVWEAIRATYVYPLEDLVERLENGDTSFIPRRKRVEAIAYAEA
jgi:flagellar protein FlaI